MVRDATARRKKRVSTSKGAETPKGATYEKGPVDPARPIKTRLATVRMALDEIVHHVPDERFARAVATFLSEADAFEGRAAPRAAPVTAAPAAPAAPKAEAQRPRPAPRPAPAPVPVVRTTVPPSSTTPPPAPETPRRRPWERDPIAAAQNTLWGGLRKP